MQDLDRQIQILVTGKLNSLKYLGSLEILYLLDMQITKVT